MKIVERKTKLKAFFELIKGNKTDKSNNTMSDISDIKPKSNLKPQKNHHIINSFIASMIKVDKSIEEAFEHKQTLPRNIISKAENIIINKFLK